MCCAQIAFAHENAIHICTYVPSALHLQKGEVHDLRTLFALCFFLFLNHPKVTDRRNILCTQRRKSSPELLRGRGSPNAPVSPPSPILPPHNYPLRFQTPISAQEHNHYFKPNQTKALHQNLSSCPGWLSQLSPFLFPQIPIKASIITTWAGT